MGRAVLAAALDAGIAIAGAFETPEAECVGAPVSSLAPQGKARESADAIIIADNFADAVRENATLIDFTSAASSLDHATQAASKGMSCVIGATGFAQQQEKAFADLAQSAAIVKSGNMSLGVNLLCALVEQAAAALPDAYDIEIVEAHHRRKTDAPSGTALMLGQAAALGRSVNLKEKSVRVRDGDVGARKPGDIGFSAIRGGGIYGDHDALFAGDKEVLSLSHRALDRSLFADGAIAAAGWLTGRAPGLYSMRDVLGL